MEYYERHEDRVKASEDDARNNLGTLASVLLGFSLLAVQAKPTELLDLLVIAWICLGAAVFLSALHSVLLTRWVRGSTFSWATVKFTINILNLGLLTVGLTALLIVAIANLSK